MKKIIMDTDFLIDCVKFKINFFEEFHRILDSSYQLCALDKTLDEIKNKATLKLITALFQVNNVEIIKTEGNDAVDDLLVNAANKDIAVATQDQGLKRRLKNKGVLVITIRQKSHLELF
ncbi:MAG: hypothetical protein PHF86_09980 [Candidatus Nanoarchaeia archaeon]|nr:hypothetical protein [Candidatus Nanoarchaeia archaeon]